MLGTLIASLDRPGVALDFVAALGEPALQARLAHAADSSGRPQADIVASVALGADFTLIGRAYLYGLMAGGRRGVDRTIAILRSEIERTMRLLGVSSLAELEPRHVTQLTRMVPVAPSLAAAVR